jgi:hypothetical protein
MRDLDPDANFQEAQYYTDQNADFDAAKVGSRSIVMLHKMICFLVLMSTEKLQRPTEKRLLLEQLLGCD